MGETTRCHEFRDRLKPKPTVTLVIVILVSYFAPGNLAVFVSKFGERNDIKNNTYEKCFGREGRKDAWEG